MSKCVGVRPICSDGRNAICNEDSGEWECPAIITEVEETKVEEEDDN